MDKLIKGIIEFRRNVQEEYREAFGKLAIGQSPDTLFIACSDSRVVPNTFASTNPGDLFVLRNVGNLVPKCDCHGKSLSDESEAAAIEFAVLTLNVKDIVICGHSECGAMRAIIGDREKVPHPNLKSWLRHGEDSLNWLKSGFTLDAKLADHNQLSQLNVLKQMEHVASYPDVQKRIEEGSLKIHGWWFDVAHADVYYFDEDEKRFMLIDEKYAKRIISKLQSHK